MIAPRLAQFVCNTSAETIAPEVFERTADLCVSALGSAILGATTEIPRALAQHIRGMAAVGEAGAIGFGFATTVDLAAMLNCTSTHATEYEDVSWPEGQYTCCLIPAMFSLGEKLNASGQDVLEAIIVGFEVAAAPATATGRDALTRGFLGSACFGALGVAAGAAKLMRLDAAGVERAITLTASMAGGLIRQAGSVAHVLEAGWAARDGVSAATLAALGLGGNPGIMDGPRGFFDAHAGQAEPQFHLGTGAHFRIMAVGQKKYPCGYRLQRILDGILAIMGQQRLGAEEVAQVTIHVNGAFSRFMKYEDPKTVEEARLCLPHAVSAALAWGHVDYRAFTTAALTDERLLSQRPKITLVEHPEWGDAMIGSSDRIQIRRVSGESHEITCSFAHGDSQDPLSRTETIDKFLLCTGEQLTDAAQHELVERIYQLRMAKQVAPLMRRMTDSSTVRHSDAA
jgi:2-methylcitrate dehydratase PrpD